MNNPERWRLILGKYSDQRFGAPLNGEQTRMDAVLDYLYGREYKGRGLREGDVKQGGSLDPSQITLVKWLNELRELFPKETVEVVEKHALDRYGINELITDPQTLEKLEPNQQLLTTLLSLRSQLKGEILTTVRKIIKHVVDEIKKKIESQIRQTLTGKVNKFRHSPIAVRQNFDASGTIRKNLKHFNVERNQLIIEQLRFFERNNLRLPWDIIICVDQSGSMADSVIHSAVMAGILSGLPSFKVKIVVFDTSIVDLSGHVDDPVEVLMHVQLGGGTDIGKAVRYCTQLVENPHRTVFVLLTDFCEGASPAELVRAVKKLAEMRVKLIGLASLDGNTDPAYDRQMAGRLADCGMEIAALTPQRLAQWLVKIIS